jgi:glucosamine--fructose-6-phosphate aminotransferase (isomerizing)
MAAQGEWRTSHPYFMHEAIYGQPSAIDRILQEEADAVGNLAENIESANRIYVVGIGTSWHAALVGEHLLRTIGEREDARAWNSFEFNAYPPPIGSGDVVIVMSHRGTKRYSAQALEAARAAGATTAVITGIGSDARADLADTVVRTSTRDPSSAFTISHTAAMTVLTMLATEIGVRAGRSIAKELQQELKQLPGLIKTTLALEPEIQNWARQGKNAERYYFAGWGPNASTAYEVALKIKESSYLMTEGFQLEQYLHGPYVATHPGVMATFIVPPGPGRDRAIDLISAVNTVGGHTVALVEQGDNEVSDLVKTSLSLPIVSEALTPIIYLAPLQLFTYWLAIESKRNPDTFRLDDSVHDSARQKYEL